MNLELDDIDAQIVDSTRQFCRAAFNREYLRTLADTGARPERSVWKIAAEQGWFSLRLAENDGGAGLGSVHAALLFQEIGHALAPGPVLWSHLAAMYLSSDTARDVAAGELVVTGAVVRDRPAFVEDLDLADCVLFARDDALVLVDAGAVVGDSRAPLDPTRRITEVSDIPGGMAVGDAQASYQLQLEGALLVAATAAGGAQAISGVAIEHAKARVQFGQPIGAFQAVKHLCVEAAIHAHSAESSVRWAALHVDEYGLDRSERVISAAKVVATNAFLDGCRTAIQVLGSMGYTWEHEAHLYLKRAHALVRQFGDPGLHARRIAADLRRAA